MRRFTVILLAAVMLFVLSFTASASVTVSENGVDIDTPLDKNLQANAPVGESLQINAKSAILMDYNTRQILYESNPDERAAPASVTKVMSLILVMEALENGKISLDDEITASEHAASMGGSQIWLEPGEVMTVDELLRATVIASANDATVALAEAVAGTEEAFVDMMNKKAEELGMDNTEFVNSYGLDAQGHLTTARDVAVMSAELIGHELIRNYTTVRIDTLRDGESELVNTNKLIRYYDGAFGLKTGTTSQAGSCLTATAERDGLTLIAVVLGAPSSKDRFSGAQKLLDYGFANYSYVEVEADMSDFGVIAVKRGTEREIVPTVDESFKVLLEKGKKNGISQTFVLESELTAPVNKGDTVGYVSILSDGEEIGVLPITAKNSSERLSYGVCLVRLVKSLFTL